MLNSLGDYWNIIKNNKYVYKFMNNKYALYGCIGYTFYWFGSFIFARITEGIKPYNAYTTANYILKDKDFIGKTVLMTGGSAGLGKETCKLLVAKGAKVYMVVRNIEKAKNAKNDIINGLNKENINIKDDSIMLLKMDLSSLQSVYDCAYNILEQGIKADFLLNNAGVMRLPKYSETIDGYESQFGINHLGHYYFTKLLMPLLIENKTRIINVASLAHLFTFHGKHSKLLQYAYENKTFMGDYKNTYAPMTNYGISKACNIIHAHSLNKEYSKHGIIALAVHPGTVATELYRHSGGIPGIGLPYYWIPLIIFYPYQYAIEVKNLQCGLATLMRCMTMTKSEIQQSIHKYYENCNPTPTVSWSLANIGSIDDMADKLCDLSDVLITSKAFPLKIQSNNTSNVVISI